MRFKVTFEVNVDPENFEDMTPAKAAHLTYEQLDEGSLLMDDLFELSDFETLKVEVVSDKED